MAADKFPTNLNGRADLPTGTVVQQYPFCPGYDGDLEYGVIGEDGSIYFNGFNTVYSII